MVCNNNNKRAFFVKSFSVVTHNSEVANRKEGDFSVIFNQYLIDK